MPVTIERYAHVMELMAKGLLDLRSANLKLALFTELYIPDLAVHKAWADLANEVSEVGTNYVSGGMAVTNPAIIRTVLVTRLKVDNLTFINLNAGLKYGVLYYNETVDPAGVDEVIKPLLALVDFNDTGTAAILTIPGMDFWIPWDPDGILEFGPCLEVCT